MDHRYYPRWALWSFFFCHAALVNVLAQEDNYGRCPEWKRLGECVNNPEWMLQECALSCSQEEMIENEQKQAAELPLPSVTETDIFEECEDIHPRCPVWASLGECDAASTEMHQYCAKSCHTCAEMWPNGALAQQKCVDGYELCHSWASQHDQCTTNPIWMHEHCPRSCGLCSNMSLDQLCVDTHKDCAFWATANECILNKSYMVPNCPQSCGGCPNDTDHEKFGAHDLRGEEEEEKKEEEEQQQEDPQEQEDDETQESDGKDMFNYDEHLDDAMKKVVEWTGTVGAKQELEEKYWRRTLLNIVSMREYMINLKKKDLPKEVFQSCLNNHKLCNFWAAVGECEANKGYMTKDCGAACNTCHLLDLKKLCEAHLDQKPAIRAGDLNKIFDKITSSSLPHNNDNTKQLEEKSQMPHYTVSVESRPSMSKATEVSVLMDKSLPPWLLSLDNFLTEEESIQMIQIRDELNNKHFDEDDGESKTTIENKFCGDHNNCRNKNFIQSIHKRIEDILEIPANNSEDFEILEYEVGNYYDMYHDFMQQQVDRKCGPRILTFLIFLNDVGKGGGIHFPALDITVHPKRGRAVLWPTVYNSNPTKKDPRLVHKSLPAEIIKFTATSRIHLYDHVTPYKIGCNEI